MGCLCIFLIFSCFLVVFSKNPIYSILSLVNCFIISSIILLLLEVEFLALSFVIIYIGAVAILFLFVILMLDLKIFKSSFFFIKHYLIIVFFHTIFFFEISRPIVSAFALPFPLTKNKLIDWLFEIETLTNIEAIGQLIYTYYFLFFIIAGFILFLAIIGVLFLIFKPKTF